MLCYRDHLLSMKLDSLDQETQIKLQGILYRSACRAWWMLAVVSLLALLYLGPLLPGLEGWVSGVLFLGAFIFSFFVTLWPNILLNEISNALPNIRELSDSAKQEVNRSGDRLADHLVPIVLVMFLVGVMFMKTCSSL